MQLWPRRSYGGRFNRSYDMLHMLFSGWSNLWFKKVIHSFLYYIEFRNTFKVDFDWRYDIWWKHSHTSIWFNLYLYNYFLRLIFDRNYLTNFNPLCMFLHLLYYICRNVSRVLKKVELNKWYDYSTTLFWRMPWYLKSV